MQNAKDLAPEADYPGTFQEVDEWFRSDAPCREYILPALAEFAFRFNRRRSKAKGLLFHRPAQQAVTAGPATHDNIVGNTDSTRPPIALE